MKNESALNMLHDVVLELYERGLEVATEYRVAKSGKKAPPTIEFYSGLAQAYWEVLEHIKNQAEVFGIYDQIPAFSQIDIDELMRMRWAPGDRQ